MKVEMKSKICVPQLTFIPQWAMVDNSMTAIPYNLILMSICVCENKQNLIKVRTRRKLSYWSMKVKMSCMNCNHIKENIVLYRIEVILLPTQHLLNKHWSLKLKKYPDRVIWHLLIWLIYFFKQWRPGPVCIFAKFDHGLFCSTTYTGHFTFDFVWKCNLPAQQFNL